MKRLLFLILVACSAIAETPVREAFPGDYTPSPCAADTAAVCQSFPKERMVGYGAAFRGFNLRQDWVEAHWNEMTKIFTPFCAKIANCFTIKDNDWVYCVDLLREEFLSSCNRFPADSDDRMQCSMFAMTYYIGLGAKTKLHKTSQDCIAGQVASGERTLQAWVSPQKLALDFDDEMTVHAYDAETRIPVRAKITITSGAIRSTEGPIPTAGYPSKWRAGLTRVPNADGHRDVVAPTVTLTATGYKPLTLPIELDVPKAIIEMTPAADQLKPGMNTITITARDAATGEPAELRVMANDLVLGNANQPLQLEWKQGQKRPEIWVTSLYDRYSDVVVAK
jgi:hypothetical protein